MVYGSPLEILKGKKYTNPHIIYSSDSEFLLVQVCSVLLAVVHVCATPLCLSMSAELIVSPTYFSPYQAACQKDYTDGDSQ